MINSVVLMGRLTYEPELKTTTSGLSVIRMNLQTLVQPFHKQPLCILFYQNHPFRSGIVSVQFTSLPHTSQPGVFCLANSSTLG